jgi:hypothetical protein
MEMRVPAILLKSVLLPTFGLPTIAATVFAMEIPSFSNHDIFYKQMILF